MIDLQAPLGVPLGNKWDLKTKNNTDGFDVTGGVDTGAGGNPRKLTVTGADITITGTGSNTYTFPAASDTLVGRISTDDMTNKRIVHGAGSTSVAPLQFTSGTNLTNPTAGAEEYDGTFLYFTPSTKANGRHKLLVAETALTGGDSNNTSASLVTITGLSINIDANEVWEFDARLGINTSSTGTAGCDFSVNLATTTTASAVQYQIVGNGSGPSSTFSGENLTTFNTASGNAYLKYINATGMVHMTGVVRNGNTDANAFTIQWTRVSSAGSASCLKDSCLIMRRIA